MDLFTIYLFAYNFFTINYSIKNLTFYTQVLTICLSLFAIIRDIIFFIRDGSYLVSILQGTIDKVIPKLVDDNFSKFYNELYPLNLLLLDPPTNWIICCGDNGRPSKFDSKKHITFDFMLIKDTNYEPDYEYENKNVDKLDYSSYENHLNSSDLIKIFENLIDSRKDTYKNWDINKDTESYKIFKGLIDCHYLNTYIDIIKNKRQIWLKYKTYCLVTSNNKISFIEYLCKNDIGDYDYNHLGLLSHDEMVEVNELNNELKNYHILSDIDKKQICFEILINIKSQYSDIIKENFKLNIIDYVIYIIYCHNNNLTEIRSNDHYIIRGNEMFFRKANYNDEKTYDNIEEWVNAGYVDNTTDDWLELSYFDFKLVYKKINEINGEKLKSMWSGYSYNNKNIYLSNTIFCVKHKKYFLSNQCHYLSPKNLLSNTIVTDIGSSTKNDSILYTDSGVYYFEYNNSTKSNYKSEYSIVKVNNKVSNRLVIGDNTIS